MKKSRRWIIVLAVLVVIGAVALLSGGIHRTIRLTAPELQAEIAKKFPFEKQELIATARFSEPTVAINSSTNKVKLGLSTTVSALGLKAASGRTNAEGLIRYEPTTGELYLDSPMVDVSGFELSGLPEKYRNAAGELIGKAMQEYLARTPIYRLSDRDAKLFSLRRNLKSLTVHDGELEIELGL